MHLERRQCTDELRRLGESGDFERLYQLLTLREFAIEARMGWQLAFLRTFAVPRMARLLTTTGELIHGTRKRAYDTGLVIYEIVHGGFDSPRARQMVSLINTVHRPWPIEQEDLTYVLCAFIVTPIRHIDRIGWRRTTEDEKQAAVTFSPTSAD